MGAKNRITEIVLLGIEKDLGYSACINDGKIIIPLKTEWAVGAALIGDIMPYLGKRSLQYKVAITYNGLGYQIEIALQFIVNTILPDMP